MAEDLFIPYRSQLPQHIQHDFEEDEVFILHSDEIFEDLITNGTKNRRFTFEEFHSFVKNRVVFITPDAAISVSHDTPSHHNYTIDTTFAFSRNTIKRTMHVSGVSAHKTSPALNFLLRLIIASESNKKYLNNEGKLNNNIMVILKCFPTTPRQNLGSLDLSPLRNLGHKRKVSSLTQNSRLSSHNKIDIDFRFLALQNEHCKLIFNEYSNIFSCVKLSQCEIDGWTTIYENTENQKIQNSTAINSSEKKVRLPQKLVLSCTQHEFRKFAEGRLLMSKETSVCELRLVLHFMLADSDVHHLVSIILNSKSLKYLSIGLLDIDDKTWTSICRSLHNNQNLKRIELAYTEDFSDSYRRLTPERRYSRTNEILELLTINKNLQEVHWPKIQQDETLIPIIEQLLMKNKRTSFPSTKQLIN